MSCTKFSGIFRIFKRKKCVFFYKNIYFFVIVNWQNFDFYVAYIFLFETKDRTKRKVEKVEFVYLRMTSTSSRKGAGRKTRILRQRQKNTCNSAHVPAHRQPPLPYLILEQLHRGTSDHQQYHYSRETRKQKTRRKERLAAAVLV